MRVTIIGAGYVGLTTGLALAFLQHRVTVVDKDPARIELLSSGKSPIHEPGIESLLASLGPEVNFTSDTRAAVADAELIMIAVGTPPKTNGEADTRYVEEAAREVAEGLRGGRSYTLVLKSTVPVGTNHLVANVVQQALQDRGVKTEVHLASNPEFLREGRALRDTFYPDRIVVGAEHPKAIEALRGLYSPILEQTFDPPRFLPRPEGYGLPPLIVTDPTSSEMTKYTANAFLALKISFINEIAGLCEKVGADVVEVARGIGYDPRIGHGFLGAGLGWGGSCFPKDTAALVSMAQKHGYAMPIVEASRIVNQRQRLHLVDRLETILKRVSNRTIGVLGLAFKPGTDDLRESPALGLIEILLERGANVRVHDPVALENAKRELRNDRVEFFRDPYAIAEGADALVLATEWPEYRSLDFERLRTKMRSPVLLDGRNFLDPTGLRKAGFVYIGVGR